MDLAATFERNWAKACRVGPADGFRPDPADVQAVMAANRPRLLATVQLLQTAAAHININEKEPDRAQDHSRR